jgi:predicted MPP superfamily phosphohydrolase
MRVAIVHLSDIHFQKAGNPVFDVLDQLVNAVNSVDAKVSLFIVIISGDIAYSGQSLEYEVATGFLKEFKNKLQKLRTDVVIEFVSVPGNHDCVLPRNEETLRKTLINGLIPTMQEEKQDEFILKQIAKAQANYDRFRASLRAGQQPWNGICEQVMIKHHDRTIQLNHYNTALLSQHDEIQGQLYLPTKTFEKQISLDLNAALSISVFHHSYLWLESNVAVAFRAHIERTSDIALSGHQHYSHSFYKQNTTTGERVLYIEAPALQDKHYPKTSAFNVLLFDIDSQQEKSVTFRRSKDIYRPVDEIDWRPITLNRSVRSTFRLNETFEASLNEHGTPIYHPVKGLLKLQEIFIFPNLTVRSAGTNVKAGSVDLRGEEQVLSYASKSRRVVFQSGSLGGKTSLARILFLRTLAAGRVTPILLHGRNITTPNETRVLADIWRAFSHQYSPELLDEFKQLPKTDRVLIIDDWDRAMNSEGRRAFLSVVAHYFDTIFLFTDDLFQMHELLNQSADTMLEFDIASIGEFGHSLRGQLIDKWVTLGREYTGDTRRMTREIEEKEQLVKGLIGKKTLPSIPFIIFSLLQAHDVERPEAAEAGSFGYIYEVLVTLALSQSKGPKAQLEKKYIFLAMLAYRMFKQATSVLPLPRIKEIAEEFSRANLVALDFDTMLRDLEAARVLTNIDGNYAFSYPHLYYYFIARYYRDNLDRDSGLQAEIDNMVDNVSSDEYSAILMFVVYFARHATGIVERLVANANRIYSQEAVANLEGDDVAFLNKLRDRPDVTIPDGELDIKKGREERREFQDQMERNVDSLAGRSSKQVAYSEELSDKDKVDLAYRHIGLLGQVIRNFPASLPGPDKLRILEATYLLGLRTLHVILRLVRTAIEQFRESAIQSVKEHYGEVEEKKVGELLNLLFLFITRLATFGILKRISGSVGVADLEAAYKQALEIVGKTSATQLVDISIKLDHFPEMPVDEVVALHKQLSLNPFGDTILADLVTAHIMVFDVDRRIRQHMASIFNFKANNPSLIDPTTKTS